MFGDHLLTGYVTSVGVIGFCCGIFQECFEHLCLKLYSETAIIISTKMAPREMDTTLWGIPSTIER